MGFVIPVQFNYDGKIRNASMGPFEHSVEREFGLSVSRRAIDECSSLEALKPATRNLLEAWAAAQTALQSLMLENMRLRQALDKRDADLRAAEEIVTEASVRIDAMREQLEHFQQLSDQQSTRARWNLRPWSR
jgi:DNA repair exonuclease SbcCD ATPase subunit